jgi:hypothetical protein
VPCGFVDPQITDRQNSNCRHQNVDITT